MSTYNPYLEDTEDISNLYQTYPGGHKLCKHKNHVGPRWLIYSEFQILRRDYNNKAQTLRSWCRTCQRVHDRYQKGMARYGRPMTPLYKRYVNGTRKLTNGERQRRYVEKLARTNPEVIEILRQRKREYDAFYRDRIRQLNGIKPRNKRPSGKESSRRLKAGPISEWVIGIVNARNMSFTEFALECGVDEKTIRSLYRRNIEYISEHIVDRMLTNEGSSLLFEIYPELYA